MKHRYIISNQSIKQRGIVLTALLTGSFQVNFTHIVQCQSHIGPEVLFHTCTRCEKLTQMCTLTNTETLTLTG